MIGMAAKIAARRALGLASVPWHEIEVERARGRAPRLALHGSAARAAARLGVTHTALTLTHDAVACIGQVVLERLEDGDERGGPRESGGPS